MNSRGLMDFNPNFGTTPRGQEDDYGQYGQPSARLNQPLEALDHAPQPRFQPDPMIGGLRLGRGVGGGGLPAAFPARTGRMR